LTKNRVDDLDTFAQELQSEILREAHARYGDLVIDHWMRPRNWGSLDEPDASAQVTGSCGDTMWITLRVHGATIVACRFTTDGCAAAIACGSVATELLLGKSLQAAARTTTTQILEALGGLPDSDRHCARLAAQTVQAAIRDHAARSLRRTSPRRSPGS